ncbi:hypothetical protein [Peribacillus sp. NPDC096540]|uniref:hypothetical protein n=1 Tax=Peribacillus sp. NPDC096540 TaxID=3390612 RepID=UPI003D0041EB
MYILELLDVYVKKRKNTTASQLEVINQGVEKKVEELAQENEWLKKRIEIQNGQIQELKKQLLQNKQEDT